MRPSTWVHVAGAVLTGAALVTWYATGSEGYTRWPNRRLAQADAAPAPGEAELLAEAGFAEPGSSPRPDIRSRFALGLVPGGTDPRHLIAVASVAGAALVASTAAALLRSSQPTPPARGERP